MLPPSLVCTLFQKASKHGLVPLLELHWVCSTVRSTQLAAEASGPADWAASGEAPRAHASPYAAGQPRMTGRTVCKRVTN